MIFQGGFTAVVRIVPFFLSEWTQIGLR